MSTYFPDESFDEPVPSSERSFNGKTESPLPTFNKAATIAICEKRLKWGAQLIAIQIARRTRRDGTFQWKLERIGELVGCSKNTVTQTIDEIVEAGLMTKRKTNTGCVYAWTLAAYKGADVGADRDIGCSYDMGFHHVVCGTYLLVWRAKYTPGETTPSTILEGDKSDIGKAPLAFLKGYAYDLATRIRLADETLEGALERALLTFWNKWITRPGLKKYKHPLSMMTERDIKEDFAAIYVDGNNGRKTANLVNASISPNATNGEVDEQEHLQHAGDALAFAKNSFNGPTGELPRRAA